MKKMLFIFVMLCLISLSINAQDKGFGLGIILGNPTGVSAKLYTGENNAFQFAAAWNFQDSGNLTAQADYLWHFAGIQVESGKLPLYVGVGGYIVFANEAVLGARIPVGLDYQFASAPIDIFIEVVPALKLAPKTDFDLSAGIGARYWFD